MLTTIHEGLIVDNMLDVRKVYFPTMLALLGYLRDPSRGPDEVRRQCPTFSEWLKPSDANPITYEELTPELLTYLRGTGAIFARKFRADTVSADHWESVVRAATGRAVPLDSKADNSSTSSSASHEVVGSSSSREKESMSQKEVSSSDAMSSASMRLNRTCSDSDCDDAKEPATKRIKSDI